MFNETLMEQILDIENLRTAVAAVKRNKGKPGIDGMTVNEIIPHLNKHWPQLKEKLLNGSYRPAMVKGVMIPKADGGQRQLGIPNVQDRVIQQAIRQQLSLVFEPGFSIHSYGYRPGRSAQDAIKAVQSFAKAGKTWCVDIDISAFFDHVNHDILMRQVSEKVKDKRVLKLIGRYLRAGRKQDGQIHKRRQGTPQGGPLSPLLANIYLDPLDKELEQRGLSFSRYADDLMIYVSSKRSAERVFTNVCDWIEKHLKLKVNRDKSGTGRPWDRKYLGFIIQEENGEIGIAAASLNRYKERVRELWRGNQSLTSKELVKQWRRYLLGWWNYFGIADVQVKSLLWELNALSGWTRRHIRKCFWQRWHSKVGRLRKLRRQQVPPHVIRRVDFHAGAWRAASHPAMHMAMNNKRLRQYGLLTPNDLAVT
jgi:group II intron reverse transcriptase/maturase